MKNLRLSALLLSSSIGVSSLFAAEATVKNEEFSIKLKMEAQAIPLEFHSLEVAPQKWTNFPIEALVAQGTTVKKGDVLITVKAEGLVKDIAKQEKEHISRLLKLGQIKQEYQILLKETKAKLATAKQTFQRHQEDYNYAIKVTIPDSEKNLEMELAIAKSTLDYYQDEFDQLKKMYAEDDLTEETEEIVLKRNKFDLKRAKLGFEKSKKEIEWKRKFGLPRDRQNWERNLTVHKLTLQTETNKLEVGLKLKKEHLEKEVKIVKDWADHIEQLRADLLLSKIKSPVDGVVYYGSFKRGFWDSTKANKALIKGGSVPTQMTFMTVIPESTKFGFTSYVSTKQRAQLAEEMSGELKLNGTLIKPTVVLKKLASFPTIARDWRIDLGSQLPAEAFVHPGTKVQVELTAYEKDSVLQIPEAGLVAKGDGAFAVKLKQASGEAQLKDVVVGKSSKGKVEILSGLNAGQVIIIPDVVKAK